jgi:hypothetical protein
MRRIFALSFFVSTVSSPAFAQFFQPGYPSVAGPAVAPPHYVVRQSAEPVTNPNAALPPAPWNSRGGGLFQGIFGGPTTTVRVYPPFAPGYAATQPNATAVYTSVNQSDAADYPIDPKYPASRHLCRR